MINDSPYSLDESPASPDGVGSPPPRRRSPVMDVEQTAEWLGVSISTIRRLIRDEELQAYRVRGQLRIFEEDVRAYLAAQRHGGR